MLDPDILRRLEMSEDLDLLWKAYTRLLSTEFPGRGTTEGQQLLCNLRDRIAELLNTSSESIQIRAEHLAANLRHTL